MLTIEKAFIDYFARLIDEVNPIGTGISLNDKLLIKDIDTNEAKSVTVSDILSFVGGSGTSGRLVKYTSTGQDESFLIQKSASIEIDEGKNFTSANGSTILSFGEVGTKYWALDNNDLNYTTGWIYGDDSYAQLGFGAGNTNISYFSADISGINGAASNGTITTNFQFGRTGTISLTTANGVTGMQLVGTPTTMILGTINHAQIDLKENSAAPTISGAVSKYSTFIGTQSSTMATGVINSVIIGGIGLYARSNNTAYVNQIGYATGASFETLLQFTAPAGSDKAIIFENASGRVLAASAVTTEVVVSDTTLTVVYNGTTYKLLAVA